MNNTAANDNSDSKPYGISKIGRTCPKCAAEVAERTGVCPGCGHQLPTGSASTLPPLKRCWEAGFPCRTRWRLFIAYEITLLVLVFLLGLGNVGSWLQLVFPGITISALAAFILGTFDRIDLRRNQHGRIALSQTWRFCFMPWKTTKIALGDYEGIATSTSHKKEVIDWVVLLWLLSLVLLPGVLWWIFVFSKPSFQVALTKDYGSPARILYRGRNEKHMLDLAKTVGEVCLFPKV